MHAGSSLRGIIKERFVRSLKWYIYPLIYFSVVSLICTYAWFNNPIVQRAGIKIVFKTIGIIPSLFFFGVITSGLLIGIIFLLLSQWLKQKSPGIYQTKGIQYLLKALGVTARAPVQTETTARSKRKKTIGVVSYAIGLLLIACGLFLTVWITRPYVTLLLSSEKIEALEKKVTSGIVSGNRIIIPTALVDAPIIEGANKWNLSRGVCHIANSPFPSEGGNCIIEGHNLAEFGWWRPQSFFSLLETVDKGTPVYVFYNGNKFEYRVRDKTYREITDPKLYDFSQGERLTLITCVSTWSPTIYTKRRTVITADPVFAGSS